MSNEIERPAIMRTEMLVYLDNLRACGITNTWGAGVYLRDEFGLNRRAAIQVLTYWMKTSRERHPDPAIMAVAAVESEAQGNYCGYLDKN